MNRHTSHPGTEELAEFGAGAADGARGDWVAAHLADCPQCASVSARLVEVSALLAAVPAPAMPEEVSQRILAALPRQDHPAPAISGTVDSVPGVSGTSGSRRSRWFPAPAGAILAAAACLVLAGVGYEVSAFSGAPSPATASGKASSAPSAPSAGITAGGIKPGPRRDSISPAMGRQAAPLFFVTETTFNYQKAALAEQVRQQVAAQHTLHFATPSAGGAPSGTASPAVTNPDKVPPSKTLGDCVLHLTGDTVPLLVERATYQSRPVYAIAVPRRAWVVTTGCTAAKPDVLASVALSPAAG
jgi:hypothetical protein